MGASNCSVAMVSHRQRVGFIEKGKKITTVVLEADAADIEFSDGFFTIKGTDRRLGIFEAAHAAATRADPRRELQRDRRRVGTALNAGLSGQPGADGVSLEYPEPTDWRLDSGLIRFSSYPVEPDPYG